MGVPASKPTDTKRQLQVIGAGYCRTGTSTFAAAMQTLLDGPAYHGGSQMIGREDAHMKVVLELFRVKDDRQRRLKLLREATAGFVAISDAPGCIYLEELCELYPDAPVICVVRDKDKWWQSMKPVAENALSWWLEPLLWPIPGRRHFPAIARGFEERNIELYGVPLGPEVYEKHIEYVKRVVPKDRLHFVELKDGWKPFCDILGRPVPTDPLPRLNDAEASDRIFGLIVLKALGVWAGIFTVAGLSVYSAMRFL